MSPHSNDNVTLRRTPRQYKWLHKQVFPVCLLQMTMSTTRTSSSGLSKTQTIPETGNHQENGYQWP